MPLPRITRCYYCAAEMSVTAIPHHLISCYEVQMERWEARGFKGKEPVEPPVAARAVQEGLNYEDGLAAPASKPKAKAKGKAGADRVEEEGSARPSGGYGAPSSPNRARSFTVSETAPEPIGRTACKKCGRNFSDDRLAVHQPLCLKQKVWNYEHPFEKDLYRYLPRPRSLTMWNKPAEAPPAEAAKPKSKAKRAGRKRAGPAPQASTVEGKKPVEPEVDPLRMRTMEAVTEAKKVHRRMTMMERAKPTEVA